MTIDCSQKGQASSVPSENPAEVKSDVKFTFVGIEPVTVPAGTYPRASKYSVTSDGKTIYYWTAPGVPTFVKLTSADSAGSGLEMRALWSLLTSPLLLGCDLVVSAGATYSCAI